MYVCMPERKHCCKLHSVLTDPAYRCQLISPLVDIPFYKYASEYDLGRAEGDAATRSPCLQPAPM
jgi:hypothetical protein